MNKDFLLIVGSPRSGTYLLSTRLNAHFSISIPVESHFIPLFGKVLCLWGDLAKYSNRKRLLRCIYEFLEIWTPRAEKGRDYNRIKTFSLLATRPMQNSIIDQSISYPEMVANLFQEYARFHHTQLWGDKSAFFNHVPLEELEKYIPNLKVIHIIRDGRDVSISWRNIWTGPLTVAESARLWVQHVREKGRWGKRNPNRYLEIRYEDLLDEPEKIFNRIGSFLGLTFNREESSAGAALAAVLAAGETHPLLWKNLDENNKEKWRTEMPEKDRVLFEYIAGSTLAASGYELEEREYSLSQRLRFNTVIFLSEIRTLLSPRHWRLQLKAFLPIVLFCSSIFSIPLAKTLNRQKFQ